MQFQGAVIKEQGVTYAVVVVKKRVVDSSIETEKTIGSFCRVFPGMPVILMAQDSRGRAIYSGRRDIVRFMVNVPLHAIPWKQYTL